ncbi:MAG: hypothetical protein HZA22_09000 [Nitrospirae bacterium]|nr:hypothetical protein [Nitrospirota bacterium]
MNRVLISVMVVMSLLSVLGCTVGNKGLDSQTAAAKPRQQAPGSHVQVTGTLTAEGVECQALRGDDGTLYTITRRPEGFKVGDRVQVSGMVAEISFCMQGTTISVTRMVKIND